jgi:class 3 adenylate cyclase
VAGLGARPADSDDVRARKGTLVIAAVVITVLSIVWVGTYLALGRPVSAAIPLGYQLISITSLAAFSRTGAYRLFRFSQLVLMLLLPFALQWSLGGYEASSAVSLWALTAALGALFFYSAREAIPWFLAFLGLTILSGLLEPMLAALAAPLPTEVRITFFVLNIVGVALTSYLLLQYFVRAREAALRRSDVLLLNVLPASIAERLKRSPGVIAESHPDVTVMFADVAGFTQYVERTPAATVVATLDEIFSAFDHLAERHGLEKIKTIGDAYMVVGGLPDPRADHADAAAEMALEMLDEMDRLRAALCIDLEIRIGMASGPVIAGVIGRRKFIYDVWGDTVNVASRLESTGIPGQIQVTAELRDRLTTRFRLDARGEIELKGKGRRATFLLVDRLEPARQSAAARTVGFRRE